MIENIYKIQEESETVILAKEFASQIKPGDVVILNGNLGAGKTFFVRNVLREYGVMNVTSPTFALVNVYGDDIKFNHFDFYRINESQELIDIGYLDYINDKNAITFIEWGSLFPGILPSKRIEINIVFDEEQRIFNISHINHD